LNYNGSKGHHLIQRQLQLLFIEGSGLAVGWKETG